MGYSRDTFYRYKQAAEEGGFEALVEQSRKGRPNLRNRTAPEIEEAIVALATDHPALGQVRASNELRKKGMHISAAGVRCVWQRHGIRFDGKFRDEYLDMEWFRNRVEARALIQQSRWERGGPKPTVLIIERISTCQRCMLHCRDVQLTSV
jgi:hypothetical protein